MNTIQKKKKKNVYSGEQRMKKHKYVVETKDESGGRTGTKFTPLKTRLTGVHQGHHLRWN